LTARPRSVVAAAAVALAGPPIAVIAAVVISSLGTALPVRLLAAIGAAALFAALVVVVRRTRWLRIPAVASTVGMLVFLTRYCGSPLPAPAPYAGALPSASPPPDMALFQLPTGVTHRTAAFGYRGGSLADNRDFTMTAVLVRHPRGDLLIDTGLGRDIDAQVQAMPFAFRVLTSYDRGRSAAEQLDAAGYDRARLRGILLTHAHWDHASGIPELPGIPVLVTAEERRFITDGGWLTAIARNARDTRFEVYGFESGPYLGFGASHDVFGDGAVVVVPAPGHTPGSVVVFVTVPGGHRYAFVGDLAWQREGITEREERAWPVRVLADDDPEAVRTNLLRMAAIATRFPEITLVPAHDARGFADLPRL